MKRPLSITTRLFLSVMGLNIMTMLAVGVLGLHSADTRIAQEYDAQLLTEANALWQILQDDVEKDEQEIFNIGGQTPLTGKEEVDVLLKYSQWRAFRVWKNGKSLIHSDNMADMPTHPSAEGFSDITVGTENWRMFSLHIPDDNVVVETMENLRNRELVWRDILTGIAGPLLILLPVFAILFSFAILYGLRGLRILTERLSARTADDLSRLKAADLPPEMQPLADAVNTLLAQLEDALTHEREFIDHAAHELRTPLAALKLQAQMVARSAQGIDLVTVSELLASVNRTAQLVEQMLLLSRVSQQNIKLQPVLLIAACREAVAAHAIHIADKRIALTLSGDEKASVMAQPELLAILIGTVLDNAVKYSPLGGAVDMHVTERKISIADQGPGIPEQERSEVFNRFYRSKTASQPGSGLGLAIASQIAHKLHAAISLKEGAGGRGLLVEITFIP